jgi:hypothetical protein
MHWLGTQRYVLDEIAEYDQALVLEVLDITDVMCALVLYLIFL